MERVFSTVLRTMMESVQLQHFNRNEVIDTDYIQFNLEHSDFVDFVYLSKSVPYEHFNFKRIIGGIMNWLNNLAQSNRQIDISHDWVICLKVSRMDEIPRGMEKKRKLFKEGNEGDRFQEENLRNQFPAKVQVQFRDDDSCFEDIMATSKSPKFNS